MLLDRFRKRKEKNKRFAHIGAGVVILVHAYEKYHSGHESWKWFLIAGIVFLSVAFMHKLIEKRAPWIDGVFFLIEATLSFIVAADYFHLGKKALPYTYLFLGCFQCFMAFRKSRKGVLHHRAGKIVG